MTSVHPDPNSAPVSRRRAIAAGGAAGIAAVALPAASAAASEGAGGSAEPQEYSVTFTADDVFTVPAGVTALTVRAEGSAGDASSPLSVVVDTNSALGASNSTTVTFKNGTPGAGGDVTGTVAVTPGEQLNIVVGGSASSPNYSVSTENNGTVVYRAGNGGRGVGVRSGSTWLLVAAGGGGAGLGGFTYNSGDGGSFTVTNNFGGNGGAAGSSGANGVTGGSTVIGGGGATTSSAGSGGSSFAFGPVNGAGSSGGAPSSSALGAGGAASASGSLRGGAGGSGYYGGGAGGSGSTDGSGAGGGGGSNYTDSVRVSGVATTASTRTYTDSALITITYIA